MEDIPVHRGNDPLKKKLLHMNMVLLFRGHPYIDDNEEETTIIPEPSSAEEEPTATSSESSTYSEAEYLRARNEPAQRYVIPQRRGQGQGNPRDRNRPREDRNHADSWWSPPRRGNRKRQPPAWMRTDDLQINMQPFVITIDPSQIVTL